VDLLLVLDDERLLVFVLLVFGTHTMLWWVRLWLDKRRGIIHGPGRPRSRHDDGHGGSATGSRAAAGVPLDSAQRGRGPYIWRFNLFHRWTHAFAMISFYVLILTGCRCASRARRSPSRSSGSGAASRAPG
jgi:hypothetical protein